MDELTKTIDYLDHLDTGWVLAIYRSADNAIALEAAKTVLNSRGFTL
jgi:hypothetical protein